MDSNHRPQHYEYCGLLQPGQLTTTQHTIDSIETLESLRTESLRDTDTAFVKHSIHVRHDIPPVAMDLQRYLKVTEVKSQEN